MKKSLFIIGAFLLSQVAAGLIILIASALSGSAESSSAISALQTSPTLISCALMTSSLLTIVATILICRHGWGTPFRWRVNTSKALPILSLSVIAAASLIMLTEALAEHLALPDNNIEIFYTISHTPIGLLSIVFLGPVAEEVACRYGIAGSLIEEHKLPAWSVVVLSAIIFSLLHLNPAQMLVAFIMGLLLGWLYVITGSLWPSLLCHVFNNAVSVLTMLANPDISPDTNLLREAIGSNAHYAALLCAGAVIGTLALWQLRRITRP